MIFPGDLTILVSKNTHKTDKKIRSYWARKCWKSGVCKALGTPLMALQLVIFDWSLLFGMLKNVSWICFVNFNLHFLLGGLVYVDKVARDKLFRDFAGGGARANANGVYFWTRPKVPCQRTDSFKNRHFSDNHPSCILGAINLHTPLLPCSESIARVEKKQKPGFPGLKTRFWFFLDQIWLDFAIYEPWTAERKTGF